MEDSTLFKCAQQHRSSDPGSYAKKFAGKYEHRTINGGVGHNQPGPVIDREFEIQFREPGVAAFDFTFG